MLGIGGVGMAGLAMLLRSQGFDVSGCDISGGRVTEWLRREGISVVSGHDASHITSDLSCVVRSAAIAPEEPEICRARELGIPVVKRGVMLPSRLKEGTSLAVSGTHGKTTTAAMTVHILSEAGRNPTFCIGGEIDMEGRVAGIGDEGLLVVEADESDGTLVHYHPTVGVITNVEFDHMEHFKDEDEFLECFARFAAQVRGCLVAGIDSPLCRGIAEGIGGARTFGFSEQADVRAGNVRPGAEGVAFELLARGEPAVAVRLRVAGSHNVLNALAAITAANECGVDMSEAARHLESFHPVRRRFEVVFKSEDVTVVSDYAHHPTEIAAVMEAAVLQSRKRVIAVFQPHRYTRTLALGSAFPDAFSGVDELILVPVYPASEKPISGGTTKDLAVHFRRSFKKTFHVAESLEESWDMLRGLVTPGDLVLIIGAGDIEQLAFRAAGHLQGEDIQ